MNGELGKDLEGCSAGIIDVLSLYLPGRPEEKHGTP
jgi:hypothetical protein